MSAVTAFTSIPAVKSYLRIPSTNVDDDGLIRSLVDAVNMELAQSLQRNILSADYTDIRNGTGTKSLVLPNYPITAVSSVEIIAQPLQPGLIPPPAVLTFGIQFTFDDYGLRYIGGVWPKGTANIKVSYTAGYAAMPGDLAHAGAKLCAMRYRELERLGQKSKSMGGEVVTYDVSDMPADVLAIVQRYQIGFPMAPQAAGIT